MQNRNQNTVWTPTNNTMLFVTLALYMKHLKNILREFSQCFPTRIRNNSPSNVLKTICIYVFLNAIMKKLSSTLTTFFFEKLN